MNEQSVRRCPMCGANVGAMDTVCPVCYAQLQAAAPTPAAPVPTDPTPVAGEVCSNCRTPLRPDQQFCPACGTSKPAAPRNDICSKCGTAIQPGQQFCPACGQKADLQMDAGVNSAISQFNANVQQQANKKKRLPLILGAVAAVILVIVLIISLQPPKVESVSLGQSSTTLRVDETFYISYSIYPAEAGENAELTWSSSDTSVARVDATGNVTAVGRGTCTITLVADDQIATMTVTVKPKAPNFQTYYTSYCKSTWATLGSNNSYLLVDTNPFNWDDDGVAYLEAYYAIEKINTAMGLPSSLMTEMGETRGIDGTKSKTFDDVGVTVSWSYHPDKGLEVYYKPIS